MKNLFSIEKSDMRTKYNFFGIKLSTFSKKESRASKIIQDSLDLNKLKNAKKLIIFLTPAKDKINGGIMSIFSLCEFSRQLNPDSFCFISTPPGDLTYVINDKFLNNEKILRFEQIIKNAENAKEIILHIPEFLSADFYKTLNKKEKIFLKSKNLQINILNQNINLMPEPDKLKDLFNLTNNVTQTIAHNRYATQDICNKYQIPTHLFSVHLDLSKYKSYSFEQKEKIIALSPDNNEYREKVIEKLKKELPDFKLITIKDLTFNQYMDLISKAFFTITFGEGMDGYFILPSVVQSIGFAVYNDEFFPDSSWLDLQNVFKTYDDLSENIIKILKDLYSNQKKYNSLSILNKQKHNEIYNLNQYKNNLKKFYEKNYDFKFKEKGVEV